MNQKKEEKTIIDNIKSGLSVALMFAGFHMVVMNYLLEIQDLYLVITIHSFLLVFVLAGAFILQRVKKTDEEKVGMAFLAITIFKMLFSIGFLYVLFMLFNYPRMLIIGHFFVPFFLYLSVEVFTALKELR